MGHVWICACWDLEGFHLRRFCCCILTALKIPESAGKGGGLGDLFTLPITQQADMVSWGWRSQAGADGLTRRGLRYQCFGVNDDEEPADHGVEGRYRKEVKIAGPLNELAVLRG